ncbi:MAG: hypothetical protein ACKV1O_07345 [Saprospiraceae bacterium]
MRTLTLVIWLNSLAVFGISQKAEYNTLAAPAVSLLDVPTLPHDRNIEVYFSGESRPAKNYLHLKYLTAQKKGHDDLNQLVLELKNQARKEGADAIMVLQTQKRVDQVVSGDVYYNVEVASMDALAVVYPENLQYYPGQLKAWKFFLPDSTGQRWQVAAVQSFNFKGQFAAQTGKKNLIDWYRFNSHQYLLETPGALIRITTDGFNRQRRRFLADNRSVRIYYEKETPKIKKLVSFKEDIAQHSILYHYTTGIERATSREIYHNLTPNTRFFEYPEFDENGKVKAYLYLKQEGEKKAQFLRVEYENYTEEDWNAHVKALIVAELGE